MKILKKIGNILLIGGCLLIMGMGLSFILMKPFNIFGAMVGGMIILLFGASAFLIIKMMKQ